MKRQGETPVEQVGTGFEKVKCGVEGGEGEFGVGEETRKLAGETAGGRGTTGKKPDRGGQRRG